MLPRPRVFLKARLPNWACQKQDSRLSGAGGLSTVDLTAAEVFNQAGA
jgi:hypothetical protein